MFGLWDMLMITQVSKYLWTYYNFVHTDENFEALLYNPLAADSMRVQLLLVVNN